MERDIFIQLFLTPSTPGFRVSCLVPWTLHGNAVIVICSMRNCPPFSWNIIGLCIWDVILGDDSHFIRCDEPLYRHNQCHKAHPSLTGGEEVRFLQIGRIPQSEKLWENRKYIQSSSGNSSLGSVSQQIIEALKNPAWIIFQYDPAI